jgi:competence protein ComEA
MERKEKLIGSIIIVIGCTIFLIVGYILSKPNYLDNNDAENTMNTNSIENKVIVDNTKAEIDKSNSEELKNIIVEIKGEVKKPNVYTLSYGSRIYDLIEIAGGFTDKADTMSINSSLKLKDEDCVIIYSVEQVNNISTNNVNANNILSVNGSRSPLLKGENEKINLNNATKEELMTLPGVGEVTAEKIIDYREEKGGFSSIEELKNISRIGDKTIDKFRDKIEVR